MKPRRTKLKKPKAWALRPPRSLDLNDLALATFACAHAINWTKAQRRSAWWRKELAKFEALNTKLQALIDRANRYSPRDEDGNIAFESGGDVEAMRLDFNGLRKAAAKLRGQK